MGNLLPLRFLKIAQSVLLVNKELKMKRKNGSILVLAVIMVVILLIIGLALITLGSNARMQAIRSQLVIEAKTAADAGMTAAIKKMRYAFDNGQPLPIPSATNIAVAGSDPPATYTYTITGTVTSGWTINSTGTVNGTQRTVHTKLLRKPIPSVAVQNSIWVQKSDFPCGSVIMQTNSTTPNAIVLKSGLTVNGDVVCGPGGDPGEVVDTKQNTSITGYTYAAQELVPFPPVTVPPPSWTVGKTAYNPVTDANVSGDKWWGATTINGILTITGPSRIFIDSGQLTLGNSAALVVSPGASLQLYLDGNLEAKNSVGLENQTNFAANLKLFGTVNCALINLKAKSGSLYVDVYAPSADVTLFNSATINGTVAANNFTMDNGGSFCADPNSAHYTLDAGQGSWWEE